MAMIAVLGRNLEVLQPVRRAVSEEGWDVAVYASDRELAPTVRHRRPDLVLIDVAPALGEEVWEMLTRLKSNVATASIPVIVTSDSVHDLQNHRDAIQRYAAAVLVRPCTDADILQCVDAARHWNPVQMETRPARSSIDLPPVTG